MDICRWNACIVFLRIRLPAASAKPFYLKGNSFKLQALQKNMQQLRVLMTSCREGGDASVRQNCIECRFSIKAEFLQDVCGSNRGCCIPYGKPLFDIRIIRKGILVIDHLLKFYKFFPSAVKQSVSG